MDRLFGLLLVLMALALPFAAQEEAQPVFFSLLFPQLMPGYEEAADAATPDEALRFGFGEAVEL